MARNRWKNVKIWDVRGAMWFRSDILLYIINTTIGALIHIDIVNKIEFILGQNFV